MIDRIATVSPAAIEMPSAKPDAGGEVFSNALTDAIRRVETYRAGAEQAVDRFLSGEDEDVHKVALATQRAELTFEMFLQTKNKVVQAYQEIMRMQL
ncbi:MAG: flagellar hook-basal body complex protein FliE [Bryobacteraceae bacterium]